MRRFCRGSRPRPRATQCTHRRRCRDLCCRCAGRSSWPPIQARPQELGGAEGVRQHDEQLTLITLLPQLEDAVLGGAELLFVIGECGQSHGQLVSVGADGFKIVLVGEVGVGAAGKARAEHVAHGIDDVLLPQEAVPATGAEVADAEAGNAAQALHFFPEAGLGARVENVELELAELFQAGAGLELVDDRERVDLPRVVSVHRPWKRSESWPSSIDSS